MKVALFTLGELYIHFLSPEPVDRLDQRREHFVRALRSLLDRPHHALCLVLARLEGQRTKNPVGVLQVRLDRLEQDLIGGGLFLRPGLLDQLGSGSGPA